MSGCEDKHRAISEAVGEAIHSGKPFYSLMHIETKKEDIGDVLNDAADKAAQRIKEMRAKVKIGMKLGAWGKK